MNSWRGGKPSGPKQSWKKPAATPVATGGKYWASGSGSQPLLSSNLVRLFLSLTVLLGGTAMLVLMLWNQHRTTPFVSIAALGYEHPWAPNSWAREDQDYFKSLNGHSSLSLAISQEGPHGSWQELIDLEIGKAPPGGPGGRWFQFWRRYRSLVVHLSAHGVLNADGEPCLLFSQADPLDDSTWVPLTQVLRLIGEHEAVQTNRARVLVLLDSGRQPPDIRCGLLTAGFVAEAAARIQALPFADFAVLLACDEGQTAWTAPELGRSVFGTMVAAGLQGLADERPVGNRNSRVSVQELEKFVAATVDGYVREHRGRVQNPRLVWSGENQQRDFEVCYAAEYAAPSVAYQSDPRVDGLASAWRQMSRWLADRPTHESWPQSVALGRLSRAEQLLWAGAAYHDAFNEELAQAQRLLASSPITPWPEAVCGASLAYLKNVAGTPEGRSALPTAASPAGTSPRVEPQAQTAAEDATSTTANSTTSGTSGGAGDGAGGPAAASPPAAAAASPDLRQQAIAWLTFTEPADEGQKPPERPPLRTPREAVEILYPWLATSPQFMNATVLGRAMDWLGPVADAHAVSREEALLRTIHEHLQLSSVWPTAASSNLGELWSQYLQVAAGCEQAIACREVRASQTMEKLSAQLLQDLQIVRDQIHGCQSPRDASDCALALEAVAEAAQQMNEQRERLERAWQLRDALATELPILAEWIASPVYPRRAMAPAVAWESSQQLFPKMADLHSQLQAGQVPDESLLAACEKPLEELVSQYSQALYDLLDVSAKSQRRTVSDLMLCLGLRPTLWRGFPLEERGRLHQGLDGRYQDFSDTVSRERLLAYCSKLETEGVDTARLWPSASSLSLDALAPYRFAEQAFGYASVAEQSSALGPRLKLAAVGGELRGVFRGLPSKLAEQARAEVQAMGSDQAAAIAAAVGALMGVEYQSHLLASLLPADRLSAAPAPETVAQQVCLQQFALWQSRRALRDFWRTPLLPLAKNQEFMLGSSSDWLARARTMPPSGPWQIAEAFQASVAERVRKWPDILRDVRSGPPPLTELSANLSLKPFPSGHAWLRLTLNGNAAKLSPLNGRRYQLELPTGALAGNAPLRSEAGELPEGNHELLAWFRGHTARAPLAVYRQQPPLTLAWQAEPAADTTVRIVAEPKAARIVFVLDCSGSMGSSLQTAKQTLLDVIPKIDAPQLTEIAVVLFGHSVTYQSKTAHSYSKWLTEHPKAPRHQPYNDVETLLPLTPLARADGSVDLAMVRELENRLAPLQPFGGTPLREAIMQSVRQLAVNDGFKGDRRVVVITDGKDRPYAYADKAQTKVLSGGLLSVPNQFVHSTQAVVDSANSNQVSLDFVPFNFAGGGKDELDTLARGTGGSVYDASDESLPEQLRNSIARDTYSVSNLDTNRRVGSRIRVSDYQSIPGDQIPGKFEVSIDNTTFRKSLELHGGETIEMQYRRQLGLNFLPYDDGDSLPEQGLFELQGQTYAAIMLAGEPTNTPQIRLCLQAQDASVQSRRPAGFLLEMRQSGSGQQGGQRLAWTSDGLWEQGHRVPVLRVLLKNLPQLERQWLEARLWVTSEAGANQAESISLARFTEQPLTIAPGVTAVAETNLESGGLRVTLTESREENAPLVFWRLQPAADAFAEHRFHSGKVVHEYFFADPAQRNKLELAPLPLPAAPSDGWQATEWIRVPQW